MENYMGIKYFINEENYSIRHNNKSDHFSIIIGENNKNYYFITLTHVDKYKNKKHMQLLYNPDKNDTNNSFVVQKVKSTSKKNFSSIKKNKILNILDKELIDKYIVAPYIEKHSTKKTEQCNEVLANSTEVKIESNSKEKVIKNQQNQAKSKDKERER